MSEKEKKPKKEKKAKGEKKPKVRVCPSDLRVRKVGWGAQIHRLCPPRV